ncbi:TlpA family protein disulfide reductase [Roseovarius spongiae]|uniref:TlpA family protein disulfide reductase n=1 Tax=Roseovarius spongiae TaxID=2320272 RepID=A0A3A8AW70_9RHOB|nr:TlpA disulfide reductase family protein [Roseovarius spongiae]RKF15337.1 TlpA family protein disulfide reductase [Roseovarius spongiae]
MRRRGFLAGALALGASPASARPVMAEHTSPRAMLSPPFRNARGDDLSLSDFGGRTVLLNIWATWCVPCREEMPTLDRLEARLGGEDFHVLALSIDRGGLDAVHAFYSEIGIRHLEIYLADQTRAMLGFGVVGLPTTILIDTRGREIARRIGPAEWDSAAAISQFQRTITKGRAGR